MNAETITADELLLILELDEPVPCLSFACEGRPRHDARWEARMTTCVCIMPGCNEARLYWETIQSLWPGELFCSFCDTTGQSITSIRPIRKGKQ